MENMFTEFDEEMMRAALSEAAAAEEYIIL